MKMIKGDTLEQQMRSVDSYLKSWNRRIPQKVIAVITPFPISGFVSDPKDNVILRHMFPVDGRITVGGCYFDDMPVGGVDIYINIHRGGGINSTSVFADSQSITIKPNAEIFAGDRLVISAVAKGGGKLTGIWTSFLWVPSTDTVEIKKFLIKEIKPEEIKEVEDGQDSDIPSTEDS